jgi:hypothetical protein
MLGTIMLSSMGSLNICCAPRPRERSTSGDRTREQRSSAMNTDVYNRSTFYSISSSPPRSLGLRKWLLLLVHYARCPSTTPRRTHTLTPILSSKIRLIKLLRIRSLYLPRCQHRRGPGPGISGEYILGGYEYAQSSGGVYHPVFDE